MIFHRISLEAFCHATEDEAKVREAMLNLVPPGFAESKINAERLEGSFGNEIISLRIEWDKQPQIKEIMSYIKEKISKEELANFFVDEHVNDDGSFWMRFDKQKAFEKELVLGGHDVIQLRCKVAAFPAKREKAVALMEEFWSF